MGKGAYVYVIRHQGLKALKVGLAGGRTGDGTARIDQHLARGWELHRAVLLPTRDQASGVEKATLKELRHVRRLAACLTVAEMPQGGFTETVSSTAISAEELWLLVLRLAETTAAVPKPRRPPPAGFVAAPIVSWPEKAQHWLSKNWKAAKQPVRGWTDCEEHGHRCMVSGYMTAGWADGMCRYCAHTPQELAAPGRVVVMEHAEYRAALVEAMPGPVAGDRVDQHRAQGWRLRAGMRGMRLREATRLEQGVLHRLSADGLGPFLSPERMPQFGCDGTVDALWMPAAALWDLLTVEAMLLKRETEIRKEACWKNYESSREFSWLKNMPASPAERRERDRSDFLTPPDTAWWAEANPTTIAWYEDIESLRNLPHSKEEWLRREVTRLGLTG